MRTMEHMCFRALLPMLALALLAGSCKSRDIQKDDFEAVSPILPKLLEGRAEAPLNLQPAILLACDRLADRLFSTFRDSSPAWSSLRPKLERHGLTFAWDHLGGCWVYVHDLLLKITQDYPGTDWEEEAFLILMRHGFNTGVVCRGGSDLFLDVIRRGERFLERSPAARTSCRGAIPSGAGLRDLVVAQQGGGQ